MPLVTIPANKLLVNKVPYKLKNHFILNIEGVDAFTVRNFKRPDVNFEEIQIPYINGRIYQAGRMEFGTSTMTLHEPLAPSASQKIMTLINRTYDWSTGRAGLPDLYKINFSLQELSGPGTVVSEWKFEGAWVQTADFGELSYEDSTPMDINVTWRFDSVYLLY